MKAKGSSYCTGHIMTAIHTYPPYLGQSHSHMAPPYSLSYNTLITSVSQSLTCVQQYCEPVGHLLCVSDILYYCGQVCVCAEVHVVELTCLRGSDESCVSLAVLPVDLQIQTLRQRYDNIHVTLVTCNQESCLRSKRTEREAETGEFKCKRQRHYRLNNKLQ